MLLLYEAKESRPSTTFATRNGEGSSLRLGLKVSTSSVCGLAHLQRSGRGRETALPSPHREQKRHTWGKEKEAAEPELESQAGSTAGSWKEDGQKDEGRQEGRRRRKGKERGRSREEEREEEQEEQEEEEEKVEEAAEQGQEQDAPNAGANVRRAVGAAQRQQRQQQ